MRVRILTAGGNRSDEEVLGARLRRDVEALSVPRHIEAQARANERTREALAARLRELGYRVREQGPHHNLVALPPDTAADTPIVAVAAHYDSVATTPGADDNASALAVLLETARACALARRPVALLAFNAEEEGLQGSTDYVRARLAGDDQDFSLEGVHVLEMVGFTAPAQSWPPGASDLFAAFDMPVPARGDFLLLGANAGSSAMFEHTMAAADRCSARPPLVALQLPPGGESVFPDITRSDHAPFWRAGLPAMLWTDTAELRSPHYHRPTDTPDTLDYLFMAGVTALLLEAVGVPAGR